MSSLLLGGQNWLNSLPRLPYCAMMIWRKELILPLYQIVLVQFILFFKSSWCKEDSAARTWIYSFPQAAATTFAFSSVFIFLLWLRWFNNMFANCLRHTVRIALWYSECRDGRDALYSQCTVYTVQYTEYSYDAQPQLWWGIVSQDDRNLCVTDLVKFCRGLTTGKKLQNYYNSFTTKNEQ